MSGYLDAECLICEKQFDSEGNEIQDYEDTDRSVGVCPSCRENAEVGRRAREMQPGDALTCAKFCGKPIWCSSQAEMCCDTPLEALRAAKIGGE